MKLLVTGGCGYLGSVLVPMLCQKHEVLVVDRGDRGLDMLPEPYPNICLDDIGQKDWIRHNNDFLKECDMIIHLAANVGEYKCSNNINDTINTNIEGTKNVCELARLLGKGIIFASSCSVYGKNTSGELTESAQLNPVGIYGRSKIQGERIVMENPDSIVLRFGTMYGWSPKMKYDLVTNEFMRRAIRGEKLIVHGGGMQKRPIVSVRDVSRAIMKIIELKEKKSFGSGTFNIVGENVSVLELAKRISAIGHVGMEVEDGIMDKRDYSASSKFFRRATGWMPEDSIEKEYDILKERGILKGDATQ